MKNLIGRTLFWFSDENGLIKILNDNFFSTSVLLNRLLNIKYTGEKIQFMNIDLASEENYKRFPINPPHSVHYYGGHLRYHGVIDFNEFYKLSEKEQTLLVWNKGYEYLKLAAEKIKNDSLLEACEYAYYKGLEIGLNPDYKMIETEVILYDIPINASIWTNFKNDRMYSKLSIEKDGKVIFEKDIDSTINGIEFFLEMYKKIEAKNNGVVIKGHYGVEYLPLFVPINKELLV
jgi:hypothetical protein